MLRKILAVIVSCAVFTTGCASASGGRSAQPPRPAVQDQSALADYVQRLPAGSKVRVERAGGTSLRGTLMKATPQAILVQRNTRVPEAPVEVPLTEVTRVTLDSGSSVGKTVAIGVGTGVATFFGVLLLLAALLND